MDVYPCVFTRTWLNSRKGHLPCRCTSSCLSPLIRLQPGMATWPHGFGLGGYGLKPAFRDGLHGWCGKRICRSLTGRFSAAWLPPLPCRVHTSSSLACACMRANGLSFACSRVCSRTRPDINCLRSPSTPPCPIGCWSLPFLHPGPPNCGVTHQQEALPTGFIQPCNCPSPRSPTTQLRA